MAAEGVLVLERCAAEVALVMARLDERQRRWVSGLLVLMLPRGGLGKVAAMAGLDEKHILKNATKHLVPESVRQRSKQPYRAPDAQSFFDTETGMARFEYVDELLSSEAITSAGLFDPAAVAKLVEKARAGAAIGAKDNMALVGILSAQLVVEQFVHGRTVDVPEAAVV